MGQDHRGLGLKGHLGQRIGNIVQQFDQAGGGCFGAFRVAPLDLNVGDGGQRLGPFDRIGNNPGGGQRFAAQARSGLALGDIAKGDDNQPGVANPPGGVHGLRP
jgi:hypothetical protein